MSDWNADANLMVDRLRARDVITLPEVDRAFRSVPRHAFLPAANAQRAYTDGAIVTKMQDGMPISSSSDPAVMAIMIEQLRLDPGARVLEIGTGTGYNAAILAEITGGKRTCRECRYRRRYLLQCERQPGPNRIRGRPCRMQGRRARHSRAGSF